MKHPHAHFLIAIANGEQIQCFYHGEWVDVSSREFFYELSKHTVLPVSFTPVLPVSYRVKPKTININGIKVPEPLREAPPKGTTVYYTSLSEIGECSFKEESPIIMFYLKSGLMHITKEAAMLHQKALLSFTSKKD